MNSDATKRSITAVVIAFIVVVIIYFSVSPLSISPRGILLPTTSPQTPISTDQVSFYNTVTAPYAHEKLGYINVQYYSEMATPDGEAHLQQYVKQIAAKAGANGVIVTLYGHTMPGDVRKELSSYIFRGIAIYSVPNI